MSTTHSDELSKAELLRELEKLREVERRLKSKAADDPTRLVHELQVHQIELEMQNRELREAQELLEESRERYSDLYDFAPVAYCTLSAKGRIEELNLTGAVLLHAERGLLIGTRFAAFVCGKDQHLFSRHLKQCSERRGRVTTELTLSIKQRGEVAMQMVSTPTLRSDGSEIGFRTALIDISALKTLEHRLRFLANAGEILASPFDYRGTLAALAHLAVPALADLCVIDVLNEAGQVERIEVLFADPQKQANLAERVRSFAPQPGWRTPQAEVITSGEPLLLAEVPTAAAVEGIAHSREHADVMRAVGVQSKMCVPLTSRGRAIGALTFVAAESGRRYSPVDLLFAEDIARRAAMALDNARLYDEAQGAIHARENLLAVVSHDLRNPLATVLMNASLLLGTVPDDRRRDRKHIETIKRAASHMNRLIRDLLDFAKIERGKLTIERSPCEAASLVSEVAEEHRALAAQRSITLTDSIEQAHLSVFCDRERIHQVFSNLIGNAIKFTKEGGSILVRCEAREDMAWFSVADSGPGISPEKLPHIFTRFWQASETARLGSGLGLSIAKGIIESHDGRIWAESEVGVGTTFYFTLPIISSDQVVLVVDDDADARSALRELLAQKGYDVVTAKNGAEALEYLRSNRAPSLILLDLIMPVMDGWEFLAERSREPALREIPVIVISAQLDVEERLSATNAHLVLKPVDPEELAETMERASH